MSTYSFMDVTATLTGPTGSIDLGYGSASSEEGIVVAMGGPKNTMTIGADGEVMHSLHADKSGTITVNLLKTSPTNKKLSLAYNAQSQSSATWGNNVIVIRNKVSGDIITARSVAFQKQPDNANAKAGKRLYSNMLIRALEVTTDKTTENVLSAVLTLRAVIISRTQQITVADKTNMKEGASTSAVQNSGNKTTKPPDTSLLKSITGNVASLLGGG
ncbi:phage structural protein [Escherichia coli]